MRILVDATAGARPKLSGVGRYVHELVSSLCQLHPSLALTLGVRLSKFRGVRHLPRKSAALRPLDDRVDRWILRGYDLFHGMDARLTTARGMRQIATLHDLFSLQRDDLAHEQFRRKKHRRYEMLASDAEHIICVSEETRRQFCKAFPGVRRKTSVIHHGVSSKFRRVEAEERERIRRKYRLPERFLLFVGLLSTRKNLLSLLQAFEEVAPQDPELTLVLAGVPSHGYEAIDTLLGKLRSRPRILLPGFVPEADLPALYSAATVFVFPTLAEGFGLPVLEAQACGTKVVATNLEVLSEVGGPGACLTDTADPSILARSLLDVLPDARNEEDVKRRIDWTRRFTWPGAAEKTLRVYRSVLGITTRSENGSNHGH